MSISPAITVTPSMTPMRCKMVWLSFGSKGALQHGVAELWFNRCYMLLH